MRTRIYTGNCWTFVLALLVGALLVCFRQMVYLVTPLNYSTNVWYTSHLDFLNSSVEMVLCWIVCRFTNITTNKQYSFSYYYFIITRALGFIRALDVLF